jgi:hypothetical protein
MIFSSCMYPFASTLKNVYLGAHVLVDVYAATAATGLVLAPGAGGLTLALIGGNVHSSVADLAAAPALVSVLKARVPVCRTLAEGVAGPTDMAVSLRRRRVSRGRAALGNRSLRQPIDLQTFFSGVAYREIYIRPAAPQV